VRRSSSEVYFLQAESEGGMPYDTACGVVTDEERGKVERLTG